MWVWSLGREDPLEEGMATHSSILAWRIPRKEEPDGPQAMGCNGSDTTEQLTHTHTHTHTHHKLCSSTVKGFPDSSLGKESACNAGDPSLIPESGRSPGEGIGYPRQYSWASLIAQLAMNLPAMRETWVQSLGWEDLLEKGKATHSSILAWRIPWAV